MPECDDLFRCCLSQLVGAECDHLLTEVDGVPGAVVIATMRGGPLIGSTELRLLPDEIASCRRLYVDAKYRRLGVGRALVEHAADVAARHGFTHLGVAVAWDNERAIAFYRALGFQRAKGFDSEDSAAFVRSLAPAFPPQSAPSRGLPWKS